MESARNSTLGKRHGVIDAIETRVIDVPIKRPHSFATSTMTTQSYLLVTVKTADGLLGYGEGVTPGGPWWGGESVETMQQMVDRYFAPALLGHSVFDLNTALAELDRCSGQSRFAKSAIEMALWDSYAKAVDSSLCRLLGGRITDGVPVRWALAGASIDGDVSEAIHFLEGGLANSFKIKGGRLSPADEVARARAITEALEGRADVLIDLNNCWDLPTALRFGPQLIDVGISVLEQPIERWNLSGLTQLKALGIPLMADESLLTPQDAIALWHHQCVDFLALKLAKSGGIQANRDIAAIARSTGLQIYFGTFMESSLGIAAFLAFAQTLPEPALGGELFGGLWLREEYVTSPVEYRNGRVYANSSLGHGMTPDKRAVERLSRRTVTTI